MMKAKIEKKKLTIKPFSRTPTLPTNFEDEAWGRLKRAVEAVIAEQAIDISKEELYRVRDHVIAFTASFHLFRMSKFSVCIN